MAAILNRWAFDAVFWALLWLARLGVLVAMIAWALSNDQRPYAEHRLRELIAAQKAAVELATGARGFGLHAVPEPYHN